MTCLNHCTLDLKIDTWRAATKLSQVDRQTDRRPINGLDPRWNYSIFHRILFLHFLLMSTTHSVDLQLHYHPATIPLPPKAHPFLSLFLFHVPIYSYDTLACSAEKISNYGRINRCRRLESMDETPAITLYHNPRTLPCQYNPPPPDPVQRRI